MFPKTEAELKEFMRTVRLCTVCSSFIPITKGKGTRCRTCFLEAAKQSMRRIRQRAYADRLTESKKKLPNHAT